MVVIQINAAYDYGSTGRTVREMHEYLVERGVVSYCYCPSENNSSNNPNTIRIGSKIDHKIHALCSRLFGCQAFFSFFATRKLISDIKKKNPQVVVLRNIHSNYINLPLMCKFLSEKDIPTVLVLHDCWFYTGHCFHYTEAGCEKWKVECHHCPLIHSHNASMLFDNSRRIFRTKRGLFKAIPRLAVVGVSDWITNEAKQSPMFENAIMVKKIYNWIDLSVFYPRDSKLMKAKHGFDHNEFVALGVAMTWDSHKGFDVFLKLAECLPQITFVMIGKVPEIQTPSNIRTIDRTSSVVELAEYYSLADVVLNLSEQESFGKVSAEALACGTPLIVNDATANSEIPGDCGFVIQKNNIDSIIAAILSIYNVGKATYINKCVKRAQELFDKNKNLEEYRRLFQLMG